MSNHIPIQSIPPDTRIRSIRKKEGPDFLLFSFKLLDQNDYFGLSGTCDRWSAELFQLFRNISNVPLNELVTGRHRTYRFHSHENASPPCPLPHNISLKESYQIRISKSKGGIHGILVDGVFYVFWLDPLHNMYPDQHYGGIKKIAKLSSCCLDLREEISNLSEQNKQLKEENEIYKELFEKSK